MSDHLSRRRPIQRQQIFISYSRSDRLTVDRIVADLRRVGYLVWLDIDAGSIPAGQAFDAVLVSEMTKSESVVFCASPDSLRSPYCRTEIEQALKEGKTIYPILLSRLEEKQTIFDIGISSKTQYIDLTYGYGDSGYHEGFKRLLESLPRAKYWYKPLLPLIALAVGTLVILIALGLTVSTLIPSPSSTPTPTQQIALCKTNDIGVVVAGFVPSNTASKDDADQIVARFSNLFKVEVTESLRKLRRTVGYIEPQEAGAIVGATARDREASARMLASRYCAAMVIYGTVDKQNGALAVQPNYYVNPDEFPDAVEISGGYRFGSPISVTGIDAPRGSSELQGYLSARATALTQVIVGLSEFSLNNLDAALQALQGAIDVPGWSDLQGREALNILIGNVHVRLAQRELSNQCQIPKVLGELTDAEHEFDTARQIAPDFSRAYSGLASTYLLQALWNTATDCSGGDLDYKLLDKALDMARTSQQKPDQPLEPAIVSRVTLTEARILYIMWQSDHYTEEQHSQFINELRDATQRVINNYRNGDNPSVAPLAIDSYILRGLVARSGEDYETAITELNHALAIPEISPDKALIALDYLGFSDEMLGRTDDARAAYQRAIKLASEANLEDQVQKFTDRLESLSPQPTPS